jgi:hypothetical protein
MQKPAKKRTGDAIQVAHSVMRDIIRTAEKPAKVPPKKKRR